jgi:hypothetical protein
MYLADAYQIISIGHELTKLWHISHIWKYITMVKIMNQSINQSIKKSHYYHELGVSKLLLNHE